MPNSWKYPTEEREWLSDFGGDHEEKGIIGTSAEMEEFLVRCEHSVADYLASRERPRRDPVLMEKAFHQCELLVEALKRASPEPEYPWDEDIELRVATDLLETLAVQLPPRQKSGRPKKKLELRLVGQMANAYIEVFKRKPPKSISSPFAECVIRTLKICQIDAQAQNLIYKVLDGKGKNPGWGEAINNLT